MRTPLFVLVSVLGAAVVCCRERGAAPTTAHNSSANQDVTAGQLGDATAPAVDARVAVRLRPSAFAVGAGMVAYVVLEPASEAGADEILPLLAGQTAAAENVRPPPRGRDDSSSVIALQPGTRLLRVVERTVSEVSLPAGADTLVLVHGANHPVFSLSNDDSGSLQQLVDGSWRAADASARAAITGSVGGDASLVSARLAQAVARGDVFASVFVACASEASCRPWMYAPPAMITLPTGADRSPVRAASTERGAVAVRAVRTSLRSLALEATELFEQRASARRLGPIAATSSVADERSIEERASEFALSGGARGVLVGWIGASASASATDVRVASWDPAARQWRTKPALAQQASSVVAVGGTSAPTVVWTRDDGHRGAATWIEGRWSAIEGTPRAGDAPDDAVVVDRETPGERPVIFVLSATNAASSQGLRSALHRYDGAWSEVSLSVP